MSICANCGSLLVTGEMCSHHVLYGGEWAKVNKIMCDAIHRGQWPKDRVEVGERQEDNTCF